MGRCPDYGGTVYMQCSVVAGASYVLLQQLSLAAVRVRECLKNARSSRVVLSVACHAVVRMHSVIRHWLTPQYFLSGEKPTYPPKRMRSGASADFVVTRN